MRAPAGLRKPVPSADDVQGQAGAALGQGGPASSRHQHHAAGIGRDPPGQFRLRLRSAQPREAAPSFSAHRHDSDCMAGAELRAALEQRLGALAIHTEVMEHPEVRPLKVTAETGPVGWAVLHVRRARQPRSGVSGSMYRENVAPGIFPRSQNTKVTLQGQQRTSVLGP
ncbi:PREDICTED: uncharacterized protein LOC108524650 [Rhinopithecus bieti]|uniref:uncharacterized protein LOC108524650 n=1 Tax=Rhinopithecus bieti TaxID=61621 RepID=UPI00083BE5E5|nr:PREDICTED: uncharacterized protein LOC108524650 [Rhinopithecus bieti]